ncbi:DNA recombination protein RmuC [Candidatus Gottesmanbacteria bacterium]|nr:DNA recombination protein RmuC [Candidatus Gottesmanbacteria bacterium]
MIEFSIIVFWVILSLAIILYLFKPKQDPAILEWLKTTNARLDEQTRLMNQAARSIGEFSEIGKSMKDLQQFLSSPKLRGGLGEQILKQLLEDSLPKQSFNLQYTFRSGVKVDAAIKTASGIIPIDSKFSMENFKKMVEDKSFEKDFQKDIKDRIDEISRKYILPDEGTVDFALMYVPSESVYYEIVNSHLMDYAYKNRVMPVSPSTFYAFLRSVLLSFEGQKIATEIKTIQQALRAIHQETNKFAELLATLQSHINNSYSMMNRVATQFISLSSKVAGVQKLEKSDGKEIES